MLTPDVVLSLAPACFEPSDSASERAIAIHTLTSQRFAASGSADHQLQNPLGSEKLLPKCCNDVCKENCDRNTVAYNTAQICRFST